MKPKVICLCGSTRFKKEFEKVTMEESLNGNIILSVGCFDHNDKLILGDKQKKELEILHRHKIDLADEIFIVNVKGYIGEATKDEIEYAKSIGKNIRYLEDPEWYGDGTYELDEVEISDEEMEKIIKECYNNSTKEKIRSEIISDLYKTLDDHDNRSLDVINKLLKKLTNLAENDEDEDLVSWSSYFDKDDIRQVSDYISDILCNGRM
jgi:hypothetical protein